MQVRLEKTQVHYITLVESLPRVRAFSRRTQQFGFVLLCIGSLASSTIVAIATRNGSRQVELAVVVVEAIVVCLFVIVLTFVLVLFLRADDIFMLGNILQKTNQTSLMKAGELK